MSLLAITVLADGETYTGSACTDVRILDEKGQKALDEDTVPGEGDDGCVTSIPIYALLALWDEKHGTKYADLAKEVAFRQDAIANGEDVD